MGRTQQHWAQLRSTMGWVVARVTHQEASLVPEQAVITTWSETSVFHLLRQASSTQKHSQQSSPPRRGPAGTWQDGDRKHSPLSLLLRATCWPLYLCLNYYCFCWLRRHAMLSLRTQVEILTSRIIPKWGIGTEKSSSRKKTGSVTSFWMDHLPLVWDLWTHLIQYLV